MEILKRVLTGHRPTGPRHIGHLVGTLNNWVKLQNQYGCFFLVADLHVLTTDYAHPEQIQKNTLEVLFDWLACGIDPSKSTLVLQSALPQHSQLAILLSMLVSPGRLERNPTYKDQVQELHMQPSLGFLAYPVMQAADILLYRANAVPVGEDQLPHIELSREIARRYNQNFGAYFPEPEGLLSNSPRLPGLDNRTMHTSYGNMLFLKDTPEETKRKIMNMYTDPTRLHSTDPGHPEGNPVFTYMELFNPDEAEVENLKSLYQDGKVGDVVLKERLSEVLNHYLEPIRERRMEISQHPADVLDLLREGSRMAYPVAQETLEEVQERMGINLKSRLGSMQADISPLPLYGAFC